MTFPVDGFTMLSRSNRNGSHDDGKERIAKVSAANVRGQVNTHSMVSPSTDGTYSLLMNNPVENEDFPFHAGPGAVFSNE